MNQKYEQQLKKGILEMLVLKLLRHKEMYGYQIISELSKDSDGIFSLKEGTLYPILYRLEDDGLLTSKWTEAKGKDVPRKYYSITESGEATLAELYSLWLNFGEKISLIMEGKK